jgi:hypothetical protein
MGAAPGRFDLAPLSEIARRLDRGPRIQQGVLYAMGAAFAVAGVYAGFVREPRSLTAVGAAVVVAWGAALLLASYWGLSRRRPADYLVVSDDEIRIAWRDSLAGINLDFADPKLRFTMSDRRGVPSPRDPRRRRPDFWLRPIGPQTSRSLPIPPAAFESILAAVQRAGLRCQREELAGAFDSVGTTVLWTVKSGRGPP